MDSEAGLCSKTRSGFITATTNGIVAQKLPSTVLSHSWHESESERMPRALEDLEDGASCVQNSGESGGGGLVWAEDEKEATEEGEGEEESTVSGVQAAGEEARHGGAAEGGGLQSEATELRQGEMVLNKRAQGHGDTERLAAGWRSGSMVARASLGPRSAVTEADLRAELAWLDLAASEGEALPVALYNDALHRCLRAAIDGLGMPAVKSAVAVLGQMERAGVAGNHNTFHFILDACLAVGTSETGRRERKALGWAMTIVQHMCALHVLPPLVTVNQLLKSYVVDDENAEGAFREGLEVVAGMMAAGLEPDLYSYNALIAGCSLHEHEAIPNALKVLELMRTSEVEPDIVTYNALIHACAKSAAFTGAAAVEQAERVLALMQASTTLQPNLISYNAVMHSCGRAALAPKEQCAEWLEKMMVVKRRIEASGLELDVRSYTTLIFGLSKGLGRIAEEARACRRSEYSSKLSRHARRWIEQVDAWTMDALALYAEMRRYGVKPNVFTYNALIGVCAKAAVRRRGRDWTAMALGLMRRMEAEGVEPNDSTFVGLLEVCATCTGRRECPRASMKTAMALLQKARRAGVEASPVVHTMVFNAARRERTAEAVESAEQLFSQLSKKQRNKHVYSSLMSAYSAVGRWQVRDGQEAVEMLENAKKDGVVPDRVMYCVCMEAIGHDREWVLRLHRQMLSQGISDTPETQRLIQRVESYRFDSLRRRCGRRARGAVGEKEREGGSGAVAATPQQQPLSVSSELSGHVHRAAPAGLGGRSEGQRRWFASAEAKKGRGGRREEEALQPRDHVPSHLRGLRRRVRSQQRHR